MVNVTIHAVVMLEPHIGQVTARTSNRSTNRLFGREHHFNVVRGACSSAITFAAHHFQYACLLTPESALAPVAEQDGQAYLFEISWIEAELLASAHQVMFEVRGQFLGLCQLRQCLRTRMCTAFVEECYGWDRIFRDSGCDLAIRDL